MSILCIHSVSIATCEKCAPKQKEPVDTLTEHRRIVCRITGGRTDGMSAAQLSNKMNFYQKQSGYNDSEISKQIDFYRRRP